MNNQTHEEYEDVESPFADKTTKLRPRKNVFNRPFAAEPVVAPAIVEPSRKSIGRANEVELNHHRASELSETQIDYLEDEEVEEEAEEEDEKPLVVRRPTTPRAVSAKKAEKNKKLLLRKAAWSVIGLLVLRLIFMDRGVWDYFTTKNSIHEMGQELKGIQKENRDLKLEIGKIQLDRNYQRQLAKEHLGVIAADEFLILFAGENPTEEDPRPSTQL